MLDEQLCPGDLIHVGRSDFGLFQSDVSDFTRSLLPESLAARVVLHRLTRIASGPLDSTRAGTAGRFEFRFPSDSDVV